MNNPIKFSFILFALMFINSCSSNINDYEEVNYSFDIKRYFSGELLAWGVIQNVNNKVERRFCVELEGTWEGNKGLLKEAFYFDDGEVSFRNWTLEKKLNNTYLGTAEDVVGTAMGVQKGFAFNMTYTLLLDVNEGQYEVSMDDWMYLIDEHKVINKTSISKLGITVANVIIFFDKNNLQSKCAISSNN